MVAVSSNLTAMSAYLANFGFKPLVFGRVTRRWLDELYSRSPVPVYERSSDFPSWRGRALGYYQPSVPDIHLSPRTPLYQRAAAFLHELGHHRCHMTGCSCWPDAKAMAESMRSGESLLGSCEAHAEAFALQACLSLRMSRSHLFLSSYQDPLHLKAAFLHHSPGSL